MAEETTIPIEQTADIEEGNKGNILKKEALLVSFQNGATVTAACEGAGISRKTFYSWLKKDPVFAAEVAHTEQSATVCVEDALFNKAVDGNVTAMIFWLCNRDADRWKNVNKVEVKKVNDFSDEELDAFIESKSRKVGIAGSPE